ncbi:hypothetical protein AT251_15590 [Enterovibrio nigricans]|nr:hypothetical protein AT251_15590 [Enterovibrio nigricans]
MDGSKTINNITNATNDMTASFDKLAKTIGGMNGGMLDLASSMLLLRNNSTEMLQANRILEVQHNSLERKYRSGKLSLEEYNKAVKNLNGHYDNAVKKIKPVNSLLVSKKFALVAVAAAAVSAGTAVSSLILENTRLAASVDMSYESLQRCRIQH